MRILIRAMIAAFLLTSLTTSAQAQTVPTNSWQGEWKSPDGSYGLSIKDCDVKGKCNINVFHIDTSSTYGSALSCLRSSSFSISPNSKIQQADMSVSGAPPNTCNISLEQADLQGGPALKIDDPHYGYSSNCDCDGIYKERTYLLQSKQNYLVNSLDSGTCLNDSRKSAQTWCTDKELQSIEENLDHLPNVNVWPAHYAWLRQALSKCDVASDIKGCLKEEYSSITELLKSASSNLQAKINLPVGAPDAGKAIIEKMAGVYKRRFQNGDSSGNKYQSEDVFEFVQVSDIAAYMKMHLEFSNGHTCSISGIVEYKQSGEFVFQDPASESSCALSVSLDGNQINFADPNGDCRDKFCGARGGFNNEGFNLNQKRKIRYMPVILKSTEYQDAISEYQARRRSGLE